MVRKVFICLDKAFPRKNAPANYVENLGKAIQSDETDVYIIGITEKPNECGRWIPYQSMKYTNVYYNTFDPLHTLKARLQIAFSMWTQINAKQIKKGDLVICYTDNYVLMKIIWAKSTLRKIKVINCVAEWYMPEQYKYGYLDVFNYWYDCLGFYRGIGCSGNVISVSRKLADYFQKRGCRTLIVPPLIDVNEFPYEENKNFDKIRFIYAGKFDKKDAMDAMLLAILGVEGEEKERIEFHITGADKTGIDNVLCQMQREHRDLADNIIIHEWMPYEELIKLYQQMHFLLIARPDNRVTQSNFPSKVPEMMSYGIIPVMNKIGDCPEVYLEDGRDSILFEECNEAGCRDVIRRVIGLSLGQRKCMQYNARQKAEENFHYQKWRKKIFNFINEV